MPGGADDFLPPKYNNLIDKDPRIVKNNEDQMDIAARPSAMPKQMANDMMTIRHVKSAS